MAFRVAFVMEIGLGHTTVYELFRRAAEQDPDLEPTWIPIEFKATDLLARVPKLRHDVVLRGGIKGRRQLAAAMRSGPFDALFFHTQLVAIFCGAFMRRIPSVVSIDATPSQFAAMGAQYGLGDPDRASLRERLRDRWYRSAFTHARQVLAMSAWAADAAREEYGLRAGATRVWHPGVDLKWWRPRAKAQDGPLRLLFVGGNFGRKGGDLLLRWMAAGGHARATLDVVTREPVEPTPGVTVYDDLGPNDDRLRHLYATSDLMVLPTRADAASLAAVEAMASGTPVLTTRIGGIPEWVGPQGECGILIEPDDYEALRAALDALVKNRVALAEMGVRARRRAVRMFDGVANVRHELAHLRNLARHAPEAPPSHRTIPSLST